LLKVAAAAQAARKSRFNRAGLSQEPAQQQQQQQQQQPSTQQHQHPHHQQSNPQQPTREAPEGRDAEAGATQYDKPGLLYGTPPETASTLLASRWGMLGRVCLPCHQWCLAGGRGEGEGPIRWVKH